MRSWARGQGVGHSQERKQGTPRPQKEMRGKQEDRHFPDSQGGEDLPGLSVDLGLV